METTIHFYDPTSDVYGLSEPGPHHIEIRSSKANTYKKRVIEDQYVLVMESLGSIETTEKQGLKLPITLCSIAAYHDIYHDKKRILMLDPANIIWEIDGVDYWKEIREKGGIA